MGLLSFESLFHVDDDLLKLVAIVWLVNLQGLVAIEIRSDSYPTLIQSIFTINLNLLFHSY